ncbi:MAG: NAD(P)/FAD-dependent oxidoreductase [Saprospiraceae bacterium]
MMTTNQIHAPNLSYWEKETFFKDIDIAIIGSGIVGLNAAIRLKELDASLRVVILERGILPMGASTKNAGFACFGSLSELIDDLAQHSMEEVLNLVSQRWEGLQRLRARVGTERLAYQAYGGYELFRSTDQLRYEACLEKLVEFNQALSSITGVADTFRLQDAKIAQFGFQQVEHLIHNQAEGQIHTGKMMEALMELARKKGVAIYTGINIQKIDEAQDQVHLSCSTTTWSIYAKKVIVATNGFAQQLLPDLAVKPARNQVLITKPIKKLAFKGCFHYDCGYFYFRNINQRILLGGGRNLAPTEETTDAFGWTPLIRTALHDLLNQVILPGQGVAVDHYWSGILGLGNQKKAIVEFVSPKVLVAVRLGGMGVAIGTLIGEAAAEEVL